jgi:hypothetical protein
MGRCHAGDARNAGFSPTEHHGRFAYVIRIVCTSLPPGPFVYIDITRVPSALYTVSEREVCTAPVMSGPVISPVAVFVAGFHVDDPIIGPVDMLSTHTPL